MKRRTANPLIQQRSYPALSSYLYTYVDIINIISIFMVEVVEDRTFPNGDRYSGNISDDLPHGLGVCHYSNGDIYDGYFKEDKKEGLGNLVTTLNNNFPISLSTSVLEIDLSGKGVKVLTSKGSIVAKACICTVSVGVLKSEKILGNSSSIFGRLKSAFGSPPFP